MRFLPRLPLPGLRSVAIAAVILASIGLGYGARALLAKADLAAAATPPQTLAATLTDSLKMPITMGQIRPTPFAGAFEVYTDNGLFYTDAEGRYGFAGRLMDLQEKRDLSAERLVALSRTDFSELPRGRAIKTVRGDGSRELAVFADPLCTYCKRLEATLKQLDNVTIYTFVYPILSPRSEEISKRIACAPDRQAAWQGWMIDHIEPPAAPDGCTAGELTANRELGEKLRITSTPTVFLMDGTRLRGALPLQQIEQAVQRAAEQTTARQTTAEPDLADHDQTATDRAGAAAAS